MKFAGSAQTSSRTILRWLWPDAAKPRNEPERLAIRSVAVCPAEGLLAIGKSTHLDGFAVRKGINVGKSNFLPFVAVLRTDASVHENHDAVSCGNELLGFAC